MREAGSLALAVVLVGCIFEKRKPDFQLSANAATQYNHRGMVQNDRGVIQGSMNADMPVTFGGAISVKSWANLDLTTDVGDAWFPDIAGGKFSEVDLTAQYSRRVGPVDLAGGVTSYILPNGSEFPNGPRGTTTEFFGLVSAPLLEDSPLFSFTPFFSGHFDTDEANGIYLNGGLAKPFRLPFFPEELRANFQLGLGYSDENHSDWAYGIADVGLADLRGTLSLSYQLNENTFTTVAVSASTMVDDELRRWFDTIAIDHDNVWGSIAIGWSF